MHLGLLYVALLVAGCHTAAPQLTSASQSRPDGQQSATNQKNEVDWQTFGDNRVPDVAFVGAHTLSKATVANLHLVWKVALPDLADERPILLKNLAWPDGTVRDVIYLTTDHGTLLALDAATGNKLWDVTPRSTNPKYTKASPAADPVQGLIYSYGLDGYVHRFRATTGHEVLGNGWPVQVTRMPVSEKISSALNLVNGYLYVTTASFSGDAPPYQGHMVAINVKTGAAHVFNSLCNDHTQLLALGECTANGGGIWARPGVVVDPVTGHIFFAVSDGLFTIPRGGHDWGDSIIEMTPDGSRVLDSYTPSNYATEAFQNRDLGSVAPVFLPVIPQSRTPYLAVQAGKEGLLRLINRQNLSGQSGPGHVGGELQTVNLQDLCPTLAQPIAWQDKTNGSTWLFVATLCHFDAFRIQTSPTGITSLQPAWKLGVEATSPLMAGGMILVAVSHKLLALDPHSGNTLWSSALPSANGSIAGVHWESPIVVGDRLFCSDESNSLAMYQL